MKSVPLISLIGINLKTRQIQLNQLESQQLGTLLVLDRDDIIRVHYNYFNEIYAHHPMGNTKARQFLSCLTNNNDLALNDVEYKEITITHLKLALAEMKNNKTLGVDGLPTQRKIWSVLERKNSFRISFRFKLVTLSFL